MSLSPMALEAFLNSNRKFAMPLMSPVNDDGGVLRVIRSLRNDEQSDSIINMAAQLNPNMTSADLMNTLMGNSSASVFPPGHDVSYPSGAYLQTHGCTNAEAYVNYPLPPISFPSNHPVLKSSTAEVLSHTPQGRQPAKKRKHVEKPMASKDVPMSESQTFRDSLPVRTNEEPGNLSLLLKKTRYDADQENINQRQHEIYQQILLKEMQDHSLQQLNTLGQQHMHQNQIHQPILHSVPQLRGHQLQLSENQMRNLLQDNFIQQISSSPLLDGGICSRRFMQYLYHLRNRPEDNSIAYWKKFVAEYFAPGSKKRWCFSTYENIEQHPTGVFCPKSMEKLSCEICGSTSGKALEATFEMFPRLFKLKFESGMVDEILFLDLPVACKLPSGLLVLEYGKAVQESVYEKFRVVHEGKLRIVFQVDLKILSWEFCAQKHEEFLLRRMITPQVNQLLQAAQRYCNGVQKNGVPVSSSEDIQRNCNMMVLTGNNIIKDVELPLLNDLGYPKRFIRCLQISEIVNSMKDLMAFSCGTKLGPIESLNIYAQGSNIGDQTEMRGATHYHAALGLAPVNYLNPLLGQNSFVPPSNKESPESILMERSNQSTGSHPQSYDSHPNNDPSPYTSPRSQSSEHSKNHHQALIDKLLHDMADANKGKRPQDTSGKLIKEKTMHRSIPNTSGSGRLLNGPVIKCTNSKQHRAETSNTGAMQVYLANVSQTDTFVDGSSHGNRSAPIVDVTVKTEPNSPPEAFRNLTGFSMMGDFQW